MTSTAIKLAKECGFHRDSQSFLNNSPEQFIERFHTRAQAAALREAAKEFNSVPMPQHWVVYALLEMVEELERQC